MQVLLITWSVKFKILAQEFHKFLAVFMFFIKVIKYFIKTLRVTKFTELNVK